MSDIEFDTYTCYRDICRGFSTDPTFPEIRVKHFTSLDIANYYTFYSKVFKRFIELGAKKESDILKEKIQSGEWLKSDDDFIEKTESNIRLMHEKKLKASLESQLEEINLIIEDYNKSIQPLKARKNLLLSGSAEKFADTATIDYILFLAFFKDDNLSERVFSLEEVEHLDERALNKYIKLYVNIKNSLSYNNIKKTSINSIFLKFFKSCNSPESFFSKNGMNLTQEQVILFENCKYYQRLIDETPDITEEDLKSPESIEKAYILSKNYQGEEASNGPRSAFIKAKNFSLR